MPGSANSETRSRLIREMSRARSKSSKASSSGSSAGSSSGSSSEPTVSDFDPENEAIHSTRQIDVSQTLPELRASAKKYRSYTRPEPDVAIDTSAIDNAFRDFSQAGVSEDTDASIEVGRGYRKVSKNTPNKINHSAEISANSPFDIGEDWNIYSNLDGRADQIKPTNGERAQKKSNRVVSAAQPYDNFDLKKTRDRVGNKEKELPIKHKPTLSEMHARVSRDYDGSYISDERPPTVNLTTRNTRFAAPKNRPSTTSRLIPEKFTSTNALLRDLSGGNQDPFTENMMNATSSSATAGGTATRQSFMLPDMPDISQLVSGIYNDGASSLSRGGNGRSRFASSGHGSAKATPQYAALEEIPIPSEERAIFASLQSLQDRVDSLESEKMAFQREMELLKAENGALKSQNKGLEKRKRSDSALGMTDGGSDHSDGGRRKATTERLSKPHLTSITEACSNSSKELQALVESLQQQLEVANHKFSVADTAIKTLTQQRDSAVAQCGVTFVKCEEIKKENEILKKENYDLKTYIASIAHQREDDTHQWAVQEEKMRVKIDRRDQALKELKDNTHDLWDLRQPSSNGAGGSKPESKPVREKKNRHKSTRKHSHKSDTVTANTERVPLDQALDAPVETGEKQQGSSSGRDQKVISQSPKLSIPQVKEVPAQGATAEMDEDTQSSGESTATTLDQYFDRALLDRIKEKVAREAGANAQQAVEDTENVTYLSYFESDEMANLRKTLEEERMARKGRAAAKNTSQPDAAGSNVDQSNRKPSEGMNGVSRKSSMKDALKQPKTNSVQYADDDLTERFSINAGDDGVSHQKDTGKDKTATDMFTRPIHARHASETTPLTKPRSRRRQQEEDMTSAFIIPDITFTMMPEQPKATPVLSEAAQRVIDRLDGHDGKNCTVCRRVNTYDQDDGTQREDHAAKPAIKIPKPVAASARILEALEYTDEPTLRPSQSPDVALATVLKGLEDELAHLKLALAKYQSQYHSHDPSLSKRKRKEVYKKMQELLQAIDTRSDQIYALYDVLEGQKSSGLEMTHDEVELTLNSIGINLEANDDAGEVETEAKSVVAEDVTTENVAPKEKPTPKPFDAALSDDSDDEELPWEGIEDTEDLSKTSKRMTWA